MREKTLGWLRDATILVNSKALVCSWLGLPDCIVLPLAVRFLTDVEFSEGGSSVGSLDGDRLVEGAELAVLGAPDTGWVFGRSCWQGEVAFEGTTVSTLAAALAVGRAFAGSGGRVLEGS